MTAPTMSGHGFTVQLPAAWEGRIYRRTAPTDPFTPENQSPGIRRGQNRSPHRAGW